MANERLPMRTVKEVLRLKYEGRLSNRIIGRNLGISRPTVVEYLKRAHAAGISWPLPVDMLESELESRLFPPARPVAVDTRPVPDCRLIYDELRDWKKVNLTLMQLWIEYKE